MCVCMHLFRRDPFHLTTESPLVNKDLDTISILSLEHRLSNNTELEGLSTLCWFPFWKFEHFNGVAYTGPIIIYLAPGKDT